MKMYDFTGKGSFFVVRAMRRAANPAAERRGFFSRIFDFIFRRGACLGMVVGADADELRVRAALDRFILVAGFVAALLIIYAVAVLIAERRASR